MSAGEKRMVIQATGAQLGLLYVYAVVYSSNDLNDNLSYITLYDNRS